MTDPSPAEQPLTPGTRDATLRALANMEHLATALLRLTSENRKRAVEAGGTHLIPVFNAVEFVTLSEADFAIVFGDMLRAGESYRALTYARLTLLVVYEALQKLPQVIGPSFRGAAGEVLPTEARASTEARLRALHSQATSMRGEAEREWGEVRRTLAAHLDADAHAREEALTAAQPGRVAPFALRLLSLYGELHEPLGRIQEATAAHLRQRGMGSE